MELLVKIIYIHIPVLLIPGPNMILVVKNSMTGIRQGISTALGICCAIWIHIFCTLVFYKYLTTQSVFKLENFKYLASVYLIYLGCKIFIKAKKQRIVYYPSNNTLYQLEQFNYGFMIDLLNPFITIFYFSLYYSIGLQESSNLVMLFCGIFCALIVLLWFTAITFIFSNKRFTNFYLKRSIIIERIAATMLVYYGFRLLC